MSVLLALAFLAAAISSPWWGPLAWGYAGKVGRSLRPWGDACELGGAFVRHADECDRGHPVQQGEAYRPLSPLVTRTPRRPRPVADAPTEQPAPVSIDRAAAKSKERR